MKKLILALALLIPLGAHAQVEPNVYRTATPSQVMATDTVARTMTASMFSSGVARFICTTACYFHVALTPNATTTTGSYLPANTPTYWQVRQGDRIQVLLSASTGLMIVQELTK